MTTTGTYYSWVRMAAGANGTGDDSFHLDLDGTVFTQNPGTTNFNNGSRSWNWLKAAGTTAFRVTISTPGTHTLNLWVREDGVLINKFVMTTNATYTPSGTGPAISTTCSVSPSRIASSRQVGSGAAETGVPFNVLTYPNPFSQEITVKIAPNRQPTSLRVLDTSGRLMLQATLPGSSGDITTPTGTLPGGQYLLDVQRDGQRRVEPVVKQ